MTARDARAARGAGPGVPVVLPAAVPTRASTTLAGILLAALLAGCAADVADDPAATPSQELLVSGAASLADVLDDLEAAFEDANPDVDVVVNLAASPVLRDQVLAGAPVDVLATADEATMRAVVDAGLVAEGPVTFATNTLAIAVPAGNPAGVTGLSSLADEALFVGLCAPGVPCGDLARTALAAAGVEPAVDSEEPDVRALLTKVAAGELDVGIVYATDVAAQAGAVDAVPVPASPTTRYPAAVLADAPAPGAARDLLAFLASERGRELLAARGFGAP